jgi:prepilin-type N-terminal cleavage/methylation domain-containing protein
MAQILSGKLFGIDVMKRFRAFTLVEILVVIAIIAILMGILLPTLSKARKSANRATCAAHLADAGKLFQMYLIDSRGKLPWVQPVPSVAPPIIPNTFPIVEIFDTYTKKARGGWECPSDRITAQTAGAPTGFETYFKREQSSYLYNPFLASLHNGDGWQIALNNFLKSFGIPQNRLSVLRDFEPFHGKPDVLGCTNHLFADMHVGDIE